MLSQTFCYWGKQQSADNNIIQLHLTLKCTKDKSYHFCDCFLVSKWIFQHHESGLAKFHAGSEQTLVYVVINNSSYRLLKRTTLFVMHLGNIECRLEGIKIIVQNIAGRKSSTVYVNQMNLNSKLKKSWEDQTEAKQKSGGPWLTQAPP